MEFFNGSEGSGSQENPCKTGVPKIEDTMDIYLNEGTRCGRVFFTVLRKPQVPSVFSSTTTAFVTKPVKNQVFSLKNTLLYSVLTLKW